MKLNTKVRYGVRSMIELALNANGTGVLQKEISERQGIPLKYLDKIIADLKLAGLIVNVGGKKSGYRLARKASDISIYDIYRAFESKLTIIQCLNEDASCCRDDSCASQEFWEKLNMEMEASMIDKTLDKLAVRQQELNSQLVEDVIEAQSV